MKALRIVGWNKHYENNRSRALVRMDWVPVPNRMDGLGYAKLVAHPNGAAHFGAWIAIVEIASRCDSRGTLIRDGQALDAEYLSVLSRLPKLLFDEALQRLVNEIKWLEIIDVHAPDVEVPDSGRLVNSSRARENGREGKGREGNGTEPAAHCGAAPPPEPPAQRSSDVELRCAALVERYPGKRGLDAGARIYIGDMNRIPPEERAALHEQIIAGIERYERSVDWRDRISGELQPEFIPPLDVFLGGRPRAGTRITSRMYLDDPPEWRPRQSKSKAESLLEQVK